MATEIKSNAFSETQSNELVNCYAKKLCVIDNQSQLTNMDHPYYSTRNDKIHADGVLICSSSPCTPSTFVFPSSLYALACRTIHGHVCPVIPLRWTSKQRSDTSDGMWQLDMWQLHMGGANACGATMLFCCTTWIDITKWLDLKKLVGMIILKYLYKIG